MRTHREAKAMARSLRACLAGKNVDVSHSECLEMVARQFGFSEWNVMAAMLRAEAAGSQPAHHTDVTLFQAVPVLRVPRIEESRPFYENFLGFTCDWDGKPGTDEMPGYARVFRNDVEIHLAEQRSGSIQGGSVLIRMRGVDALHRELAGRNTAFRLSEVSFTPWDSRVFVAADPFGNRLRFWENNPPGVAWSGPPGDRGPLQASSQ
jgi:catechol 2,3-dioxygenase-like lactoylglutathione lyase family enzyme